MNKHLGNYPDNRTFGDKFMPGVMCILGQKFYTQDQVFEDMEHNTDLTTINLGNLRFGVRIRKHSWLNTYPDDFTVRFKLKSGGKTEFEKVIEGWGDYLFYGFADENETRIVKWAIIDYSVFRRYCFQIAMKGKWIHFQRKHTHDADGGKGNTLLAIRRNEIPGIVVADSETWDGIVPSNWVKPMDQIQLAMNM